MPTMAELHLDALNVEDRVALAQEIWDSVVADLNAATPTDAQRAGLERRLADSIARPDAVTPWEEVEARVLD